MCPPKPQMINRTYFCGLRKVYLKPRQHRRPLPHTMMMMIHPVSMEQPAGMSRRPEDEMMSESSEEEPSKEPLQGSDPDPKQRLPLLLLKYKFYRSEIWPLLNKDFLADFWSLSFTLTDFVCRVHFAPRPKLLSLLTMCTTLCGETKENTDLLMRAQSLFVNLWPAGLCLCSSHRCLFLKYVALMYCSSWFACCIIFLWICLLYTIVNSSHTKSINWLILDLLLPQLTL